MKNYMLTRCLVSTGVISSVLRNTSKTLQTNGQLCKFSVPSRCQSVSHKVIKGSSSEPPLVLAHGVCGNKHNFTSIGKRLSKVLNRNIITFDARNHGNSFHSDNMDLTDLTSDIISLLDLLDIEKCVLIGHSMGGRTSIVTALLHPERIAKLVVVDASPRKMKTGSSVLSHIEAMQGCDFTKAETLTEARKVADQQLEAASTPPAIRAFLLQNIIARNGFQWRVNLDAILHHLRNSNSILDDPATENMRYNGDTLFLCGTNSNYVTTADFPIIKKLLPHVTITHIPGAGHWVHADKPNEFIQHIRNFVEPPQTSPVF